MSEQGPLEPAPQPSAPPRQWQGLIFPLLVVLAGVWLMCLTGFLELRWLDKQPWHNSILAPDYLFKGEEVYPAWVRSVPSHNFPSHPLEDALRRTPGVTEVVPLFSFDKTERVVAIDLPRENMEALLVSGRLPEPGTNEVLAGDLARLDSFDLDGDEFTVVGRLQPYVGGLFFSYIVPLHENVEAHFNNKAGATQGSFHPSGLRKVRELCGISEEDGETGREFPKIVGGRIRSKPVFYWTTFLGLALVAFGGAIAHIRLFDLIARTSSPGGGNKGIVLQLMQETVQRRNLFVATHIALYAVMFSAMAAVSQRPLFNYYLMQFVANMFESGQLSYIGQAYQSENILRATVATFVNNYIVQTVGMTFGTSILIPAVGALKTALSFAFAGFVMSPLWIGTASQFWFHSITMTLELEAYILASFVVIVWPIRLFRACTTGLWREEGLLGVRIYLGGLVVTGIMLAIAALYEAATLILLR